MKQKEQEWLNRWGTWSKPTTTPGIFQRKDGGFLVRKRITISNPAKLTEKREQEIKQVLPNATFGEAVRWLEQEADRRRSGTEAPSQDAAKPLFSEYAASLLAHKIDAGDLKSPASKAKWRYGLIHLVEGTKNEDGEFLNDGLGDYYVDKITFAVLKEWRAGCGRLVQQGLYDPSTVNQSWIPILRTIMRAAAREHGFGDPTDALQRLDESEHPDFTEEEPNALTPEQLGAFLREFEADYPQLFAFALVGFATGLRPSHLRPLRRTGPDRDVLWDEGVLLVRRSETENHDPMNKTKTGVRQRIPLPEEVMQKLRWHVETQLTTREQRESDLLFPSIVGGYRTNTLLRKPFAAVLTKLGIKTKLTAKGMRRTFCDMSRLAGVSDVVTRAITGHLTPSMLPLYSTSRTDERRDGIASVIDLAARRATKVPVVAARDATEPTPKTASRG